MTNTSEHFGISSILVPQKPHKVQICLGLRPHRQPLGLPLGSKSILWLFWHRRQGKMGGSRRHRIGQEMERRESGYLDRCRTSRFLFLLLFNTHKCKITIIFAPTPPLITLFISPLKTSFNVTGRPTYPISASVVNPECRERPTPFTFKSSYCPRISSARPPTRSAQKPRRQWLCGYACRRATIIVTSSFPVLPRTMFGMLRGIFLPRFINLPRAREVAWGKIWCRTIGMMEEKKKSIFFPNP